METGHVVLRREELDLRLLASEAVERIQLQRERSTIRIEVPESAVVGSWDRSRLEEVLDNLLSNAVKYSPESGQIVILIEAADGEARLSVADEGVGIRDEALPQVFERFQRAEDAGVPGLGLGLYIAHLLIEAHHGRIGVESTPGQGTTFTISLPLTSAA